MTTTSKPFQTVTVADIFKAYSEYLQEEKKTAELSNAKTALVRFTVPGWSKIYPAGTKSTAEQMKEGLAFLSQVTAEQFKEASSVQEAVFEHLQIDKDHRRRNRSPLNQMVTWAETQGYFGSTEPEGEAAQTEAEVPFRLLSPKGQRRKYANDIKLRKKPRRKAYALGTQPGDYVNNALEKQLKDLVAYLSKRIRERTIQQNLEPIKQLLGGLHREEGISLDDLKLESIVPFTPLKPILDNYRYKKGKNKGLIDTRRHERAEATLKLEAKAQAPKTVKRIEEYLTLQGNHPGTDTIAMTSFINVAKFLYRYETEEEEEFDDIEVIKKLRKLRARIAKLRKKTPPTVPHSKKRIPWEDALKVLRAVQKEADLRTCPSRRSRPLPETAIARNVQRLLILLLFMASPPDRSRTIYELEVGRTFEFGEYKNEIFTAAADMKNPDEAEWLFHLYHADYKTGDKYGEVWDSLPNTPEGFLADGKTLYDYLDLWRNQYRAVFKPTHNCLLTTTFADKPLGSSSMWSRVRHTFFKHTGVPVSPKELRKMYVTYLKDSGATEAELEGAAARQRQSREMQSEVYDQQERGNKVAPVEEFHERTMKALFKDDQQKGA